MKSNRIFRKRSYPAQGLVEFALTIPIFLVVVLGIIELSRFFLIYSSVYTASREAARYAVAIGDDASLTHDLDCAGIKKVAVDEGFVAGITADQVTVRIQELPSNLALSGATTTVCETFTSSGKKTEMGDRILINISTTFQPIMGIIPTMAVNASADRTIMKDIDIYGTPPPTLPPATPVPQPTQVPIVHAGIDQFLPENQTINLDGTVDTANPPTVAWTLTNGPGTATFANAAAVDTSVVVTVAGIYEFRLTATYTYPNSTVLTVFDSVIIRINALPAVNASSDQINENSICSVADSATLPGTATDDGLPDPPGILAIAWTKISGPGNVTFANAALASTSANFSLPGNYVLQLSADDNARTGTDQVAISVNAPPTVNAGTDKTSVIDSITKGGTTSVTGTVTDDGLRTSLTTTWSKESGPGTVLFGSPSSLTSNATFPNSGTYWGTYVLKLTANDGCPLVTDTVSIRVNGRPLVQAGGPIDIERPATLPDTMSIPLSGITASDPDSWPNAALTYVWSKNGATTGAGSVSFDSTTKLMPVVTISGSKSTSISGTYILGINVYDGKEHVTDTLTIRINAWPTANAGQDQIVTLSNGTASATLIGTASDPDAQPSALATSWRQISGPGIVNTTPTSGSTRTVTFTEFGIYTYEFRAYDGLKWVTDTVSIRVNAPPALEAGGPMDVERPATMPDSLSIPISGVSAYDPDAWPNALTFSWKKISGPGNVVFDSTTNLLPVVTISTSGTTSISGTYVLEISAFDGLATGTDTLTLQVNAWPVVNAGLDRTVTLDTYGTASITLTGSALDPDVQPSTLTTSWRQVSGPGIVDTSPTSGSSRTVNFTEVGTYTYEFRAYDGLKMVTDTILVTVQ